MSETIIAPKKASEEQNTIVDDSYLIKSYDNAINLHDSLLARHIAQSTNNLDEGKKISATLKMDEPQTDFKVGDYARATYDDGVDYEGKILSINEEGNCTLKYIGYENEQEVRMMDLLPSWGKTERRAQFKLAKEQVPIEKAEVLYENNTKPKVHDGAVPKMPQLPMLPPMPPMLADSVNSEELSAMLMSWYMSGYYTGYYTAQMEKKTNPKTIKSQKK